jgi:hypothetical protein
VENAAIRFPKTSNDAAIVGKYCRCRAKIGAFEGIFLQNFAAN